MHFYKEIPVTNFLHSERMDVAGRNFVGKSKKSSSAAKQYVSGRPRTVCQPSTLNAPTSSMNLGVVRQHHTLGEQRGAARRPDRKVSALLDPRRLQPSVRVSSPATPCSAPHLNRLFTPVNISVF